MCVCVHVFNKVSEVQDKDFASELEGVICMCTDVSADKVRLLAVAMCSDRIVVVYDYKNVCTCYYGL